MYKQDPTCTIFLKSLGRKDAKYDILIKMTKKKDTDKYKDKYTDKDKYTEKHNVKVQKRPHMCDIFEKQMAQGYQL